MNNGIAELAAYPVSAACTKVAIVFIVPGLVATVKSKDQDRGRWMFRVLVLLRLVVIDDA